MRLPGRLLRPLLHAFIEALHEFVLELRRSRQLRVLRVKSPQPLRDYSETLDQLALTSQRCLPEGIRIVHHVLHEMRRQDIQDLHPVV